MSSLVSADLPALEAGGTRNSYYGLIDEVLIYDKALSVREIQGIAKAGAVKADLNGNNRVNIYDFALFSGQWFTCGNPHDPNWCP